MRLIDADALAERLNIKESCAECEYEHGGFCKKHGNFVDACEAIFDAPTIQPEPHWIPVEQELPKENYLDDGYVEPSQPVLVYMSYHTCKISRYWGHRKSKGTSDYVIPDWMDLEEYDGENVIAWMPLPEPYKGVTE